MTRTEEQMRTYKFSTPQQQDTVAARIYTRTKWEVKKGFSTSYNPKVSKFDLYCGNVIIKLKVTTEIKMVKGLAVTSTARCRRRGQARSAVASDGV